MMRPLRLEDEAEITPISMRLEDCSERYRRAVAKEQELYRYQAARESRLREIEAELARLGDNSSDRAMVERLMEADDIESALNGGDIRTRREALQEECRQLREQIRTIRKAVEMTKHERQAARGEASKALCAKLAPRYHQLVGNLAQALVAAAQANEALRELTDQLTAEDVAWTGFLRPMGFNPLSRPQDRYSHLALWLSEATEYQLIDGKIIPDEWRTKWRG
jgi:chromosome segregation ATPase